MDLSTEKLNKYKESLLSAWGYNDYNDWPVKFNSIMHLFGEDFSESFLEDIRVLCEKGYSIQEMALSFGSPARIYRIINAIIYGMKQKKVPLKDQRRVVLYLLDMVQCLKYGSPFNEDGRNIVLSSDQVDRDYLENIFHRAEENEAIYLQRFCGIMWAYTEAIFFRAHDVTKEIHGPYVIPAKTDKLLVREYLHLDVQSIWGDFVNLPANNIKIYTVYDKNLSLSIDAYNHLFLCGGNYVKSLKEYRVEIDGKEASIDQLMHLVPYMQETIRKIHEWIKETSWKEHACKYADIYWYRKKPLADMLNKSWEVPEQVYEKIRNGHQSEERLKKMSDRQIELLIKTLI